MNTVNAGGAGSPLRVSSPRLVGVLGGMGPQATVAFLAKVVEVTPATCDQEHVPLLVHQVPQIPDRSRAILSGSDAPFEPMLSGLKRLALAGATFAVIPCNSAHYWYERLMASQPLKILHIGDAVSIELQRRAISSCRVGILATRGTLRGGVYDGRLGEQVSSNVMLDEATQALVDQSILAIKTGQHGLAAVAARDAVVRARAQGVEVPILACTELPVALAEDPILETCIDSSLALAHYCVAVSCNGQESDGPYRTKRSGKSRR